MAGSMNEVTLIGNVGQDPDIRTTQDGKEIANVTLATSESWKDKSTGERKEKTEWHRIVVFNEAIAGVVRLYVRKGSKLMVRGKLQTRKWKDNDGVERYSTEVVLQGYDSKLVLLGGKSDAEAGEVSAPAKQTPGKSYPLIDDEIPW